MMNLDDEKFEKLPGRRPSRRKPCGWFKRNRGRAGSISNRTANRTIRNFVRARET